MQKSGGGRGAKGKRDKGEGSWIPRVSQWKKEVLQWGEREASSKGGLFVELINAGLIYWLSFHMFGIILDGISW